ncbi:MAG TPA: bifunctional demethylmenaquinone methyltransferase/2-methoxy-6-polyprenyl-1,4-benzoquinol methylase UbiE [Hyphomicrobiaceae bacterium]|nr:bifunctional demethylmenaquinone methyltransferase/2-methoxy-6-polyprenyl-1,4-benzoquinol methylase UbiE [Hyphomicrobiaceae bacterium]
MTTKDDTVSFGFRDVPAADKARLVRGVFDSVASKYDLMNDLMSGFIHRLWKDAMVQWLNPQPGMAFADIGGGTGDIAMRIVEAGGDEVRVDLCDISPEMVAVGQRRVEAAGLQDRITLTVGNAEALPFADRSFDAYTIAFGIRNVTRIEQALREAFRVLKPGGRFMCLEFSEVTVPGLDKLYDFHSFNVIPELGQLAAGDRDSYQYLVESIRRFPNQETFAGMVRAAGFERVTYRNLTGGVAAMHSGWRI